MKVGDIVKFKNGRSYYQQRGYSYMRLSHPAYSGGSGSVRTIPVSDGIGGDNYQGQWVGSQAGDLVDKPFPKNMRGKLAIITKIHEGYNEAPDGAIEVCMITHDPYGNGDKIIPLPNARVATPGAGGTYGFIEGLDLEVISSGADQ